MMSGGGPAVRGERPPSAPVDPCRVAVIGRGAIGSVVAHQLAAGAVPGVVLAGVATRSDVVALVRTADVVVEAAGHEALRTHAVAILESGRDLLALSAGALADEQFRRAIAAAGPGRFIVCSGAVGGLGFLRAARLLGAFDELRLTTTKVPHVLRRPWMDDALAETLALGRTACVVFEGSAAAAAERFPESVNVAATIAVALDAWEHLQVTVMADPAATLTTHRIDARGPAGEHRFELRNQPSADNPATSAVVARSVLVALADLVQGAPVLP